MAEEVSEECDDFLSSFSKTVRDAPLLETLSLAVTDEPVDVLLLGRWLFAYACMGINKLDGIKPLSRLKHLELDETAVNVWQLFLVLSRAKVRSVSLRRIRHIRFALFGEREDDPEKVTESDSTSKTLRDRMQAISECDIEAWDHVYDGRELERVKQKAS